MQPINLLSQVNDALNLLKEKITQFEDIALPNDNQANDLLNNLNQAIKIISAYSVLSSNHKMVTDLDLHLKIMAVPEKKELIIEELIAEVPSINIVDSEPIKQNVVLAEPEVVVAKKDELKQVETPIEKIYPKINININDKFRFISELFKSNAENYNATIDKINEFTNYEECQSFLTNLQITNQWNKDAELVKKIQSLAQKRFL